MKVLLNTCLIILLSVSFYVPASQQNYQALVEKYIGANVSEYMPGASVIVSKNGVPLFSGATGYANIEHKVKLKSNSVFPIASITKQFTASAILKLAEQGKLSLNDKLSKYLPTYPTGEQEVSISQLLSHTAGFSDYVRKLDSFQSDIGSHIELDELLAKTEKLPMIAKPGSRMAYSNTGYLLLGKIIEIVSGKPYGQYLETEFFHPLQLTNTYYQQNQIIPNRVNGYQFKDRKLTNSIHFDTSWGHAAGAIYSTTEDLNKWFHALMSGKVIDIANVTLMTTAAKLNDGTQTQYGLGVALGQFGGSKTITHGGHIYGFRNTFTYMPEQKLFVAVLCNYEQCNPSKLSQFLIASAMQQPIPSFTSLNYVPANVSELLGTYEIDENQTRIFLKIGDELFTQREGGEKVKVLAMSENTFFYQGTITYFSIEKAKDGTYEMHFKRNLGAVSQIARKL